MNAFTQSSGKFPVTLHEWESLLSVALLLVDDENADAIQSFEITPETLASCCGSGPEYASIAENAFRQALKAEPHLFSYLQHGVHPNAKADTPGCLAPLVLSLLVDSLIDGDYEGTGAFRNRLSQWLGLNRSFMNLRGIAIMWQELSVWLDNRSSAGAPFRRLLLPTIPPGWTHIGYTRYLSFPTRRDQNFLKRIITRNPRAAHDPEGLVKLLDPIINTSSVSLGLKQAFGDFRIALRSCGASVDHRFWKLVKRAYSAAGQRMAATAELRMEFDEDGNRYFIVRIDGSSSEALHCDIENASMHRSLLESPNLGGAARRGLLFFRSAGLASWTALAEAPVGTGQFHFAVAERYYRLAAGLTSRFLRSGAWYITIDPVASAVISDFLNRLGITGNTASVRLIDLVDGVRVGRAWLGLPRFLPRVENAPDAVEIRPASELSSPSQIEFNNGEIRADAPLLGEFVISNRMAGWSRRAVFVSTAEAHVELDGANYALPLMKEWTTSHTEPHLSFVSFDPVWDDCLYEFQDVLEALYASARTGIDEGKALDLIGRAAGERNWELLRTLQESTFLDAHLRLRWRGRVFTLVRPTLIESRSTTASYVIVSGAIPARVERDFRQTVELQGGRPFRRTRKASFAPPLIGALDVDAKKLASGLGWAISTANSPDGNVSEALGETRVVGESYIPSSAWDWSKSRFTRQPRASGQVSLTRLVHPGHRDHDLYRIAGSDRRTYVSRYSAIVELHSQAGVPLFRYRNGVIQRIAADGALPLEIARALRLRTLLNGGAASDGWEYAAAPLDAQWLFKLLRRVIDGVTPGKTADVASLHRRGRGARRTLWVDGSIVE